MKNTPLAFGLIASLAACGGPQSKSSLQNPEVSQNCDGTQDVPATDPACEAISSAIKKWFLTVDTQGDFKPDEFILRGSGLHTILLACDSDFKQDTNYCHEQSPFPDVPVTDENAQTICYAKNKQIVTGYKGPPAPGNYGPENNLNHAELATLFARIKWGQSQIDANKDTPSYKGLPTGQWYTGAASFAYTHNLFMVNELNPSAPTTKKEMAWAISSACPESP